jgi:hypothetical protein
MQVLFQKLLGRSDGWNQTQKEAMIDLCLLGMYSDDLTSLAEQDFIEDESTHLKWESGISFSGYLQRTVPKIRMAKGDSQKMEDVLQNIGDRLGSDELKRKACNELQKLLATDEVVKVEEEFLSKVQRVMGI